MLTKSTVDVASQLAASLAERGILLSLKGEVQTPVSVLATHYHVGSPGLRRSLNDAAIHKLNEDFLKRNSEQASEMVADQRDELIDLISTGQTSFLKRIRQEILPKCKEVKEVMEDVTRQHLPEIEVKKANLCPLLADPALVSHLEEYPRKHILKSEYRTVKLPMPSAETIIEWAKQTPHFDEETVAKWLLETFTSEDIRVVFGELFDGHLVFGHGQLSFTRPTRLFTSSNELLLAYFLTAYLKENPVTPSQQSMGIDEWEEMFETLHRLFGVKLIEFFKVRHQYQKTERVVVEYSHQDMTKGGGYLFVTVNPDVYPEWIAKGNTVKTLLGAGVTDNHNTMCAKDFAGSEQRLATLWERKHAIIRSRRSVESTRQYRSSLAHAITNVFGGDRAKRQEVESLLAKMNETKLDNVWECIFDVVCGCYYPSPMYRRFLGFMQHYSAMDKDNREAALLANTEVMALQLRSMVSYDKVELDCVDLDAGQSGEV